eukprot:6445171-Prymnesium_polylepis.1
MVKATLCVSNKLTFLAQGETECPTLFVIRPVERAGGVLCVKLGSLLTQARRARTARAHAFRTHTYSLFTRCLSTTPATSQAAHKAARWCVVERTSLQR